MKTLKNEVLVSPGLKLSPLPKKPDPDDFTIIPMQPALILIFLLLIWCFAPQLLHLLDAQTGVVDQSIWLLIILSLICYLLIAGLCWWLLKKFWEHAGLPSIHIMVSQFYLLSPCQQLSFFLALFALLLLSAIQCLSAIC